jgi:thiol peroxidase
MATVTLGGIPAKIKGEIPKPGEKAKDFRFVNTDLSDGSLFGEGNTVKVIIAIPSLETSVCATETRKFNEKLSSLGDGVSGLVISKDLPFSMKKFCEVEGIKNVRAVSDFRYHDFVTTYNTEILEGAFKGLSARAVFVVDSQNKISYSELVSEIGHEPNYDKALATVKALL